MSATGKKPARHVYKTGAAGCGGKAAPTVAKNAGQPLPCPFCDRIFKQDGRLKEHLKNKHAGEELQESGALEEGSDPAPESASTSESVQNSQRDEHGYPIKTPKTLLHEWCQKNKKPQPKFKAVEVEGGFQCRVILPDAKKSEADVILWYKGTPTRTSTEAQHRASIVALHHLMGNRSLKIFYLQLGGDHRKLCPGQIDHLFSLKRNSICDHNVRRRLWGCVPYTMVPVAAPCVLSELSGDVDRSFMEFDPPLSLLRLDRVLGEDYKQLWFDLDKAAEERKAYLKLHPPRLKPKPAPIQRELHSVFMSEGNRRLVEDILRGSETGDDGTDSRASLRHEVMDENGNETDAGTWEGLSENGRSEVDRSHWQTTCKVSPKMKYREKDSDAQSSTRNRVLVDASPKDQLRSQLLRFGFKLHHVNAAIVERAELSRALDWLVLKVPEQELPAKFAAESSKASVQVLVRGKQATSKAYEHIDLSSQSVARLQEYGYSDVDCIAALWESNGDEWLALGGLFKSLMSDQGLDNLENGASESLEAAVETRDEELVALQSIFEEKTVSLSADFMRFNLSLDNSIEASLEMEVRIPPGSRYPYESPILAFRGTGLPPEFLVELTRQVGECASQISGPMLYDLVCTATEFAQSLLPKYNILMEDIAEDSAFSDEDPITEVEPELGSEILGKPAASVFDNLEAISLDDKANDISNKQSKAYVPPAFRTAPVNQVTDLSAQTADDTGQQDQQKRKDTDRGRMGQAKTTAETKRLQEEEYMICAANIRFESVRLKEEWEAWQASPWHSEMRGVRAKLPAYKSRSELLRAISSCSVTIVCGQTGCGKSTQVPQYVLEDYIEMLRGGECNIICTQPRRLSAIGLADRVAKERGQAVGTTVGYSVRVDSCRSSRTRLLFCTTGILLRRLLSDPALIGVTHVIVDEVHERSLESDLLLLLLRQFLRRANNTLRVILMSATVDAGLFGDYFRKELGYKPPIMNIPGFTFPVRELYLEDALELTGYRVGRNSRYALRKKLSSAEGFAEPIVTSLNQGLSSFTRDLDSWESGLDEVENPDIVGMEMYSESTQQSLSIVDQNIINFELIEMLICSIMQQEVEPYTKYGQLMASYKDSEGREGGAAPSSSDQKTGAGAILVFLPGVLEIRKLQQRLQSSNQLAGLGLGDLWVLALHGSLSGEEQKRVFMKPPRGVRKVVLATNIAETSITIDDVVYVIDSGRHKEMRYEHNRGLSCLEDTWVSKANAKQRRGRAGRVRPGCCFRLFSRQQFQNFDDQQLPEMLRVSLEGLCLRVKSLLPGKVEEVVSQMVTPPSSEAVRTSLKSLEDLNALDKAEMLTPLGQHLARMPVDARVGKMLIFACMLKCLDPLLTIAASLSGRSPFMSPMEKREEASAARAKLAGNSKSDHMTVVAAYNGWMSAKLDGWSSERDYCSSNFLSRETLLGIEASRSDYLKILVDLGFLLGDGHYTVSGNPLNVNSNSVRVVKALICAGFYPNIVRVHHPEKTYVQTEGGTMVKMAAAHELRLFTKEDGRVFLHPSSVNFPVGIFESPWLVFTEKVKTSKVFLRESTMIPAYALLLFGGEIRVKHERQAITVDDWLQFEAPARIAVLIRELRLKVDSILLDKIQRPSVDISCSPVVTALTRLLTTDGF